MSNIDELRTKVLSKVEAKLADVLKDEITSVKGLTWNFIFNGKYEPRPTALITTKMEPIIVYAIGGREIASMYHSGERIRRIHPAFPGKEVWVECNKGTFVFGLYITEIPKSSIKIDVVEDMNNLLAAMEDKRKPGKPVAELKTTVKEEKVETVDKSKKSKKK